MKNINEVKDFMEADLLTPKQVCSMLNITRYKLMQILRMGELPYIENKGRIRIERRHIANLKLR